MLSLTYMYVRLLIFCAFQRQVRVRPGTRDRPLTPIFVRQVTNFPILFLHRPALDVCLPDNNRKQRAMFEKLKQAYVKARPCRVQRAHRRARSRDKKPLLPRPEPADPGRLRCRARRHRLALLLPLHELDAGLLGPAFSCSGHGWGTGLTPGRSSFLHRLPVRPPASNCPRMLAAKSQN